MAVWNSMSNELDESIIIGCYEQCYGCIGYYWILCYGKI